MSPEINIQAQSGVVHMDIIQRNHYAAMGIAFFLMPIGFLIDVNVFTLSFSSIWIILMASIVYVVGYHRARAIWPILPRWGYGAVMVSLVVPAILFMIWYRAHF